MVASSTRSRTLASRRRQIDSSSPSALASWARTLPRAGSCQRLGSFSSRLTASSRVALRSRSKMLLELQDLGQKLLGPGENVFHVR